MSGTVSLTINEIWGIAIAVLVVAVVGVGLFFAARSPKDPRIGKLGPSFFFWLGLSYLGVLLAIAILYNANFYGIKDTLPVLLGGLLPIGVPWFGALGAVVISLQGVFQYNFQATGGWDPTYNYWHLARPLFGAVLGIVAFFLFVLLLQAAGTTPAFQAPENGAPNANDLIVYYVVAFLVGYREETFAELIKRVTDILLKPGEAAPPTPKPAVTFRVDGAQVTLIDFGHIPQDQTSTRLVEVHNAGTAELASPEVSINEPPGVTAFVPTNDMVTGGGDLAPGAFRTVEVTFTPTAVSSYTGTLSVTSASLDSPASIDLSGEGRV